MRFLVTGASGFIGSRLAESLAARFGKSNVQLLLPPKSKHAKEADRRDRLTGAGYDIVCADLLDLPADFAGSVKPFDVLFHLAAFGETESRDTDMNAVNDRGTRELIRRLAGHLKGARLVYTSTLAAVDRSSADNSPLTEDYPCRPRTTYGVTKLKAESIVRGDSAEIGYRWAIMRLPTVIGAGYRPGGLAEAIIDDLRRGGLFTRLNWPGRIELVHVDDVVETLVHVVVQPDAADNALFHLSSGIAPTLDDMIGRIAGLAGLRRRRIALPGIFWSVVNAVVWCAPLARVLPFDLRVMFWRLSLITSDGFVGASVRPVRPSSHRFKSLDEMLLETYSSGEKQ